MSAIEEIRRRISEEGLKAPTIENRSNGELKRGTIDKIISGLTKDPRLETVLSLAKVYGLTVSQLIGEVNPPAEIPRGLCTWDDLRECLESLGVGEVEAFVSIAETSVGGSKGLGKKRQLGQGGKS